MIWLTWRQLRVQAAVVFGVVAAFAIVLAATGPRLADEYHAGGTGFLDGLGTADSALYVVGWLAVLLLPLLIGMFWGAPLVTRELDAGTHRLAWTQTTRTRWLVTKLGITGAAAMAATGLLSLAVSWWAGPIDAAIADLNGRPGPGVFVLPRLSRVIFDARGIVPVGYAAFAFVVGVTLGVVVRRTLPAMVVLLAVFTVTQIAVSVMVRPHLVTPESLTTTITADNLTRIGMSGNVVVAIDRPGAWIMSQHTVDAAGRAVSAPSWVMNCPSRVREEARQCYTKLADLGYRQRVTYQPAGRFWAFQLRETALYVGLAVLLTGLCAWRIRRLS